MGTQTYAGKLAPAVGGGLGGLPRRSKSVISTSVASKTMKKVVNSVETSINFAGSSQSIIYTPILFGTNRVLVPARYYMNSAFYYGYTLYDIADDLTLSNEYRSAFTTDSSAAIWSDSQWQYTVSDNYVITQHGASLIGYTLVGNTLTTSQLAINTSGTYSNGGTYTSQSFIQHIIVDGLILTFMLDNLGYLAVQKSNLDFSYISTTKSGSTSSVSAVHTIYKTDFGFLYMYVMNQGGNGVTVYFKALSQTFTQISSKAIALSSTLTTNAITSYFEEGIASVICSNGSGSAYGITQACLKVDSYGVMTTTYTSVTIPSQYSNIIAGLVGSTGVQMDTFANVFGVRSSFYGYTALMYDGKTKLPLLRGVSNLSGTGVGGYKLLLQQASISGDVLLDTRLDQVIPKSNKNLIGLFGSSYNGYSQDVNIVGGFVFGAAISYVDTYTYIFLGKIE